MENIRSCEICNVNVLKASYVKHLRNKKHLGNEKHNEMTVPEWLFKEEQPPIKNKTKKVYNPKTLKHIARENDKINDKEIDKELAKMMVNPYYFTEENLKRAFKLI